MTRRRKRLALGGGGVAGLLVLLGLAPEVGSVGVFIAAVGLPLAWVAGFTRTPRVVRSALREVRQQPPPLPVAVPDVTERVYRYAGRRWSVWLIVGPAMRVLAAAIVLAMAGQATLRVRLAMALPLAVGMALLGYVGWVVPRSGVHVEPWGLESRDLFGRVRMAWTEIVGTYASVIDLQGSPYTSNLYVYSRDDLITISDRLPGFAELTELIRRHAPSLG